MNFTITPTEAITLRMLDRAADEGLPCPTNMQIAEELGFADPGPVVRTLRNLARKGLIMVESGHQWRIITLCASGREITSVTAVKRGVVV